MTAFASGERQGPAGTLGCELRAVNHRFLELGMRLPDELRAQVDACVGRETGWPVHLATGTPTVTVALRTPWDLAASGARGTTT